MKILSESQNGSKISHKMDATPEEIELIKSADFAVFSCGTVQTINKADKFSFDAFVYKYNESKKNTTEKPAAPKSKTERYTELLEVAERNGLNHGASWYCTGSMVDEKSLPPHWEGEEICYVYP